MAKLRSIVVALLLLAVQGSLPPCPSGASTAPPPGEETLFEMADYVVEGQVERVTSVWDEEQGTIYTLITLAVSNHLKGNLPDSVTIKHLGGEVDDLSLVVSTEPSFTVGEEVRLYLVQLEDGRLRTLWGYEGKISLGGPVAPQYTYNGNRWRDTDIPVPYYIHNVGTPDIPGTAEFAAVQSAFQSWEDVSCSYMEFDYQGTTSTPPSAYNSYDGINVVGWMTQAAWGDSPPPNALAVDQYWYSGGWLTEFDITFFEDHTWVIGSQAGKYDVQSVGTHEAGHALSLGHSSIPAAVMYHSIGSGQIKRTLHQDDIDGICAIYPQTTVAPTSLTFLQDDTSDEVFPASQAVSIDGGNAWTSAASPWVNRIPVSGTAPSTVTVSTTGTTGWVPNTYTGVLTITDSATSDDYPVQITLIVADLSFVYLPLVTRNYP